MNGKRTCVFAACALFAVVLTLPSIGTLALSLSSGEDSSSYAATSALLVLALVALWLALAALLRALRVSVRVR